MMKYIFLLVNLVIHIQLFAQSDPELPAIDLLTLDGDSINTSSFYIKDSLIIISCWATWCKPCIKELNELSLKYDNWRDSNDVVLYAVSIDNDKKRDKVRSFVNKRNWPFQVLLDENKKLISALSHYKDKGFLIPHVLIYNGKGNLLWSNISKKESSEKMKIDEEYYYHDPTISEIEKFIN